MITGIGFPVLPHGFPQWIHPPAKSCPMRSRFVADQLPCRSPEIAPRRKTGVTAADAPGLVVHGKGRSIVHATDVAKVLWNWERNGVEPLEVWHWIFLDILQEIQEYIKSRLKNLQHLPLRIHLLVIPLPTFSSQEVFGMFSSCSLTTCHVETHTTCEDQRQVQRRLPKSAAACPPHCHPHEPRKNISTQRWDVDLDKQLHDVMESFNAHIFDDIIKPCQPCHASILTPSACVQMQGQKGPHALAEGYLGWWCLNKFKVSAQTGCEDAGIDIFFAEF